MGNGAPRPIALPPLSQHLREIASHRGAWLVLVRNFIPVVGIWFFGWSAALSAFNYWFDGLTAVAAIIAAMVPRAMRETQPKTQNVFVRCVLGVFTWLILLAFVGLPYWIVLIPLHDLLLLLGYFGAELKFCPTSVTCGAGLQSCAPPFPSLLDTIRAKKNRRPAGAASAGVCSLVDLL